MITPPFLQKGDKIALLSTARFIDQEMASSFCKLMEEYGFEPIVEEESFSRFNQMAGNEIHRAKLFQNLLDNPEIKAIWMARGGYGSVQIMDRIDWNSFLKSPKWVIGFSDVTVWHSIINKMGVKTIHAPMPSTFSVTESQALNQTFQLLQFGRSQINFPSHPLNSKSFSSKGILLGGNMSIICSLIGTESLPSFEKSILCLEDVGEYLYHIDRMMFQLNRANLIQNVEAILVGGMTDMNDNSVPFGETPYQIIKRHTHALGIPTLFDVPFGHIPNNRPLLMGGLAIIEPEGDGYSLSFS